MRRESNTKLIMGRRQFVQSASLALAVPAVSAIAPTFAFAQSAATVADPFDDWRELRRLTARAVDMGLSVPRMSARLDISGGHDYTQIMPAAVELIENLDTAQPRVTTPAGEVERLIFEAENLLRRVHQAERNLPEERDAGMSIATQSGRPDFESLRDEYRALFASCEVRDQHRSTVDWYMSKILTEGHQARWYSVAQEACCPWYFVSIIHAMEAAFSFRSHLHNGDPLSSRTTHVPRGRPQTWNPPNDWETSAADALAFDGFIDVSDWTLERTLYRWEAYNGFRSRKNGINTPYLWSFSNHYAKGKFVADNVWDPNAVSKQCGAAVMLKVLAERNLIRIPQD